MKVLVGSVFAECDRSDKWYSLQIRNLQQTTDFTHVVYPNYNGYFPDSIVLPRGFLCGRTAHVQGLNSLLDYFKTRDDFDYFLLLDSDCFPICDWTNKLLTAMKNFDVAAPARYENLDTFAHPSAFFFKRKALGNLKFGVNNLNNIIGENYVETSSNVDKFFPLIRTNVINDHPLLFGIYWNIFYHHGAGSRSLAFRCTDNKYYNVDNDVALENRMFDNLTSNSKNFINRLIGKHSDKKYRLY